MRPGYPVFLSALVLFLLMHASSPISPVNTGEPPADLSLPEEELPYFHLLRQRAAALPDFIRREGLSDQFCFLLDMSLPSGRKRFFIYDLNSDTVITSGLVAHGSCNEPFIENANFSNKVGGGCSSDGRYRVSHPYEGRFGTAYKLVGLDSTNSNAFRRYVVLHAYDCVPDAEIFPDPICNSLGCPMVSYAFLQELSGFIRKSPKPVLLWIF